MLIAGTGTEKVSTTKVVVMKNDGGTAVTLMPDYQGDLQPFAMIFAVPSDVNMENVQALKREFVDRVDRVSAPRFAEFWEKDPCEPGKAEQVWEVSRKAADDTGFLGVMKTDPSKKVEKELLLDVDAQKKEGEYGDGIVGSKAELMAWLEKKGFKLPEGGDASLSQYENEGYRFVALPVDTNRIELIGGSRAVLSPVRYFTAQSLKDIPVKFGLPSASEHHDLYVYTLAPKRMEVKNYTTKPAPTNLSVDFVVKERMGEFYNALYDKFAAKHPNTFVLEYAFPTSGCGNPCPTEPLLPHEMMSLGGDAFDALLSDEEKNPEPPEPTEEEKAKIDALLEVKKGKEKIDAKKDWEESRKELARRKALIARHTYVLSRLHYRYTGEQLPKDPELGPAEPIRGGVALPEGPEGAADPSVQPSEENAFQTRFVNLHPNKTVINCEDPKRYRWGKPPRTYRGSSKIWVAEDMTHKSRTQINPDEVVLTAVAELELEGGSIQEKEKEAPAPPAPKEEESDCGCRAAGVPARSNVLWMLGLALGLGLWRRRRAA